MQKTNLAALIRGYGLWKGSLEDVDSEVEGGGGKEDDGDEKEDTKILPSPYRELDTRC